MRNLNFKPQRATAIVVLFLFAMLHDIQQSSAQDQTNVFVKKHHFVKSTDVWNFMRQESTNSNGTSVDYYTGTMSHTIPIYHYSDKDFDIPISITFTSKGYVPNIPGGSVGAGWFLNVGGVITREVRGIPDEYNPDPRYTADYLDYPVSSVAGYYKYFTYSGGASNNDWTLRTYTYTGSQPEGYCMDYVHHASFNSPTEVTPDVFSFNFLGHTGKFNMHMREVLVYDTSEPQGEYKVNINNSLSQIIITTGDGYVYTFEGLDGSVTRITNYYESNEISNSGYNVREETTKYQNQPMSEYSYWYLTQIEAPEYTDGRKVVFTYSEPYEVQTSVPGGYKEKINGGPLNYVLSLTNYTTKIRQLTGINIADVCSVNFTYESSIPIETGMYAGNTPSGTGIIPYPRRVTDFAVAKKMTGIVVNDTSSSIQNTLMSASLTYRSHGNQEYCLEKLQLSNVGTFAFDYYSSNSIATDYRLSKGMPILGTVSTDYWGYYTGDDKPSLAEAGYIPGFGSGANTPLKNLASREPNYSGSVMGMLAKIKYPTGGHTEFEYELHDASEYVSRSATVNKGLPALSDYGTVENHKVGGVRIKKITDVDQNKRYAREFIYTRTGNHANTSSGILYHFPVYYTSFNHNGRTVERITPYNQALLPKDKSHIGYSRVVEKRNDKSSIEYCFSTYEDAPDDNTMGTPVGYNASNQLFREVVSHAADRGKLKSARAFDNNNNPVSETMWSYDTAKSLKYAAQGVDTSSANVEHITLVESYPLATETATTIFESGSVHTETSYSYNDLGQLRQVKTIDSKGDTFGNYVQYAHETDSRMMSNNMLVQPARVIKTHKKKNSSETTVIEDEAYGYGGSESPAVFSNGPMSMSASTNTQGGTLAGGAPGIGTMSLIQPPLDIPDQDITLPGVEFPTGLGNSWAGGLPYIVLRSPPEIIYLPNVFPIISDFIYDRYGNLLQKKENGIFHTCLWGYKGLYKIADIENTSLEEVTQKLGITQWHLPLVAGLTEEQERLLRELPEALVTTYKYKPFIGVTEQTDISGKKEFYEYYPGGKLKSIKDDKERLVQSFDYSIK